MQVMRNDDYNSQSEQTSEKSKLIEEQELRHRFQILLSPELKCFSIGLLCASVILVMYHTGY